MDGAARQDYRRKRAISAAVHDDLDVLGDQPAVMRDAAPVPDDGRVPLGGRRQILVALVDHAHRFAAAPRQQRRVDGDHGGVLLLATEAAAGLGLDDHGLVAGQRESAFECLVDVVRALERALHRDAAVVARYGDHGLVLDVELFLVADTVGPLDDQVGLGEAGVDVALGKLEVSELLPRFERIEDRRQRLRAEADASSGPAQRGAIGRGDERDRFGVVADLGRDERRLIVRDETDHVLAGDVGGGHDDHLRPVEVRIEVDAEQAGMGLGGADGRAVPGTRDDEVISVFRGAGQFLRAFTPTRRGVGVGSPDADLARHWRHEP